MKRLLIILALALGGIFATSETAHAWPRVYRGYYGPGPGYRYYAPRVYAPRPYRYYAPRYYTYSYGYPRVYGGWWGYRPTPYYYGGPFVYYGW